MFQHNLITRLTLAGLALLIAGLVIGFPQFSDARSRHAGTRVVQQAAPRQERPPVEPPPDLGEPAPRPPLERPTRTPRKDDDDDDDRGGTSTPGRITGTVIDLRTGAPAAAVAVSVGGVIVYTDANGNYDRPGLARGRYYLTLVMGTAQGTPSSPPIQLYLDEGQTVIQHLSFVSPPPTTLETSSVDATPTPPQPTVVLMPVQSLGD